MQNLIWFSCIFLTDQNDESNTPENVIASGVIYTQSNNQNGDIPTSSNQSGMLNDGNSSKTHVDPSFEKTKSYLLEKTNLFCETKITLVGDNAPKNDNDSNVFYLYLTETGNYRKFSYQTTWKFSHPNKTKDTTKYEVKLGSMRLRSENKRLKGLFVSKTNKINASRNDGKENHKIFENSGNCLFCAEYKEYVKKRYVFVEDGIYSLGKEDLTGEIKAFVICKNGLNFTMPHVMKEGNDISEYVTNTENLLLVDKNNFVKWIDGMQKSGENEILIENRFRYDGGEGSVYIKKADKVKIQQMGCIKQTQSYLETSETENTLLGEIKQKLDGEEKNTDGQPEKPDVPSVTEEQKALEEEKRKEDEELKKQQREEELKQRQEIKKQEQERKKLEEEKRKQRQELDRQKAKELEEAKQRQESERQRRAEEERKAEKLKSENRKKREDKEKKNSKQKNWRNKKQKS